MYHWYDFENIRRGTYHFPIEFYYVTESHPRYVMPYHWHLEIEIIRVTRGTFTITAEDTSYRLEANDILFIPSNAVHGGVPAADCIYECIVADLHGLLQRNAFFASCAELFSDSKKIMPLYRQAQEDTEVYTALMRLFTTMRDRNDGWQLLTIGCLFVFFGLTLESGRFEQTSSDTLHGSYTHIAQFQKVFNLIRTRYAEPITLEDMACEANMSPNYFCQRFKEATHYSPIEYLIQYRIEYSKYLLCVKNLSVSEAAFLSGFNTCAYYIKVFKKFTGETPNKYKKAFFAQTAGREG